MKPPKILLLILISFLMVLLHSCAVNPVTGKRQFMLMSEAREISMGTEYDVQISSAFGLYENQPVLSLIREKGKEMGLISHRPQLEYHFRILDSPVINAFAVPGGYIYFTRGILAQFNNEAELMGVLGHEMGHITARHSVSRLSKQQLGQLLLIGGMIASEEFRKYGEYAMQGMQLLFLSFSREDEREADRLGVEYTAKIGYDASKMADFYQILVRMNLASSQGGIPTFLSTHPDPGDRYNDVKRDAGEWKEKLDFTTWKVNEEPYLRMLDGMVYGEDPRQGFTEGNVFYHPDLRFKFPYPTGWELQNSPLQVQIAPPDGNALIVFNIVDQPTLNDAAEATLQQLGLNVLEKTNTSVNGMSVIRVLSNQVSSGGSTGQEQTIQVLSFFIDYNGTFYAFHGVAAQENFRNYAGTFESVMANFDKLSDPAKLSVQPMRIRIRAVQNPGTLSNIFRSFGVPQDQMEEFAFLNNMELTDQVGAGKLLKIATR